MRLLSTLSVAILFILQGCSSDVAAPSIQRISKIEVFDVGNTGNASDIVVRYSVENIGGVDEFRIIVIPESGVASFSSKNAVRLSSDQYFSAGVSTDATQVVRLSNVLDTEGSPVINNRNYVVKLIAIGDRLNQLSEVESNLLTLDVRGIYEGSYVGNLCCFIFSDIDERWDIAMTLNGFNNYNGEAVIGPLGRPDPLGADVSIVVDGDLITDFQFRNIEVGPGVEDNGRLLLVKLVDCDLQPVFGVGLFQDLGFDIEFNNCEIPHVTLEMSRVLSLPD